jgi:hypothetical protein
MGSVGEGDGVVVKVGEGIEVSAGVSKSSGVFNAHPVMIKTQRKNHRRNFTMELKPPQ